MKKLLIASLMPVFGLIFFAVSGAALAGDPVAGKTKSAACGGCHGFDGNSPIATYP
jgi:cytochrome c553